MTLSVGGIASPITLPERRTADADQLVSVASPTSPVLPAAAEHGTVLWRIHPRQQLSSSENIRLLSPEASTGDCLEFSLWEASFPREQERAPAYCALSYFWGDEDATETIKINGAVHRVTPNLLSGLQAIAKGLHRWKMRDSDPISSSPWLLWIDAICINQHDDDEKSSQVMRMDQIFGRASTVFVWLGEHANNSQKFMRILYIVDRYFIIRRRNRGREQEKAALRDLRHSSNSVAVACGVEIEALSAFLEFCWELHAYVEEIDLLGPEECRTFARSFSRFHALFPKDSFFWPAMFALTARPWFKRIWTLQEIILAKHAIVLCGDDSIHWIGLPEIWMNLCHTGWAGTLFEHDTVKAVFGDVVPNETHSQDYELRYNKPIGAESFFELMMSTRKRRARNPRDYIYGLIGLLDDSLKPKFAPDYGLEPEVPFVAAVQLVCKQHGGVSSWCRPTELDDPPSSDRPRLPTWCPDLGNRPLGNISQSIHLTVSSEAKEALTTNAPIPFGEGSSVQMPVAFVDVVRRRSSLAAPASHSVTLDTQFSPSATRDDLEIAFEMLYSEPYQAWLAAIAALFGAKDGESATEELAKWLKIFFFSFHGAMKDDPTNLLFFDLFRNEALMRDFISEAEAEQSEIQKDAQTRLLFLFIRRAFLWGRWRVYFSTEKGNIGHSYHFLDVGDHICYIPGSYNIRALSSTRDEYKGLVSVDGLQGDALLDILPRDGAGEVAWESVTLH